VLSDLVLSDKTQESRLAGGLLENICSSDITDAKLSSFISYYFDAQWLGFIAVQFIPVSLFFLFLMYVR
jgi:hypothetical protein